MNPDTIKQSIQAVIDGLTPLAEKLNVPITQLWGIMIKQNYVYAVYNLIWVIICGIGIFIGYKLIKWFYTNSLKSDDDGWWIGIFLTTLAIIIVTVSGAFLLQTAIGRFINPPYYAIQDITHFIKK